MFKNFSIYFFAYNTIKIFIINNIIINKYKKYEIFNKTSDYEAFKLGEDYVIPNICHIEETNGIRCNPNIVNTNKITTEYIITASDISQNLNYIVLSELFDYTDGDIPLDVEDILINGESLIRPIRNISNEPRLLSFGDGNPENFIFSEDSWVKFPELELEIQFEKGLTNNYDFIVIMYRADDYGNDLNETVVIPVNEIENAEYGRFVDDEKTKFKFDSNYMKFMGKMMDETSIICYGVSFKNEEQMQQGFTEENYINATIHAKYNKLPYIVRVRPTEPCIYTVEYYAKKNYSKANVLMNRCSGTYTYKVDFSQFDTSHITDMSGISRFNRRLNVVDFSNCDISKVVNFENMFFGCDNLEDGNDTNDNIIFYYPLKDKDKWDILFESGVINLPSNFTKIAK